jgi:hypothetical protein
LQGWIGSLVSSGPDFESQGISMLFDSPCPKSIRALYFTESTQDASVIAKKRVHGTFLPGPIKRVDRTFAKINRVYSGDTRGVTDIVRCSVLLNSIADVNSFLEELKENCYWEPEPSSASFCRLKLRICNGENPFTGMHLGKISWIEKVHLYHTFLANIFRSRVLGLPIVSRMNLTYLDGADLDKNPLLVIAENIVSKNNDLIAKNGDHLNSKLLKTLTDNSITEALLRISAPKPFQILRIRNRFLAPVAVGGYRDVNIKVKVGFKQNAVSHAPTFVPVDKWCDKGVRTVICEIQVRSMHTFGCQLRCHIYVML